MNVLYCCGDEYVKYMGVSIYSLYDNNRDIEQLEVYILAYKFSEESVQKLNMIANQYNRTIHYLPMDDFMSYIPIEISDVGYPPVALGRLLMCHYLPNDVEEILYIDCDTIVNGSLNSILDIKIADSNFLLAAVPELSMPAGIKARIGHRKHDIYYNAGVQLCNVKLWRKEDLSAIYMNYYADKKGKLLYFDQDIMNACCKGRIKYLSYEYNISGNTPYFPLYYIKRLQPAYEVLSPKDHKRIIGSPTIIHYMGDERPWIKGNYNYYRKNYNKYYTSSPWADEPLIEGKELYLFCYHILNIITYICPPFRSLFTRVIGINKYLWWGKE